MFLLYLIRGCLICTQEITVIYSDSNNLIHNGVYDSTTNIWAEGDLSRSNFITSPDAGLSVTYNDYFGPEDPQSSALIAYQDSDDYIQIVNQTSTSRTSTRFSLNPIKNTGLALFYPTYLKYGHLKLFYQMSNSSLRQAQWYNRRGCKETMHMAPLIFHNCDILTTSILR